MKIIFMGTPDFAVPSLQALIEKFGVQCVFTQPDRPKGRGNKVTMSPVKEVALKNNIPVLQPIKLKNNSEMIELIKGYKPDFIIVVAFGQILTKDILDIPKYGCINLHASLLPKYRGAAPINWCIINGEVESGNTTMLMDIGIDTGDMLLKQTIALDDKITAGELHDILSNNGAKLLIESIEGLVNKTITPEKQQDSLSNYAPMLNKNLAEINWNKSSKEIHNLIRGLNPRLVTYTNYKGITMKIYESEVVDKNSKLEPGTIIDVSKSGIEVTTKDKVLLIKKIQFPNSKPLKVSEYLNGNDIETNVKLGKEF